MDECRCGCAAEIERLRAALAERDAEMARLRAALEWYADTHNYKPWRSVTAFSGEQLHWNVVDDKGFKARAALDAPGGRAEGAGS